GMLDSTANGTYAISFPTIGGTVNGLVGTVVLQNNGGDNKSISGNGSFTFATSMSAGSAYNVTILTQPGGATCTLSNATGTVSVNVTTITVSCVTPGAQWAKIPVSSN